MKEINKQSDPEKYKSHIAKHNREPELLKQVEDLEQQLQAYKDRETQLKEWSKTLPASLLAIKVYKTFNEEQILNKEGR